MAKQIDDNDRARADGHASLVPEAAVIHFPNSGPPGLAAPALPTPPPQLVADAATIEWARPLPPAVPSPFPSLNRLLNGGFRAESIYISSGPMGRGKTGFALQITRGIARAGHSALYLTTELSIRQVVARIVAQETRRRWLDVWQQTPETADQVRHAVEGLPLRVARVKSAEEAVAEIQRAADADGEAPFVTVDYLQRLARQYTEDRRIAVAKVSDMLVECSIALRIPIYAISSTGRANYTDDQSKSARDYASAGKESGDLDFDGSGLFFLHTEECPPDGTAAAQLHIAKNRYGSDGMALGFRFDGAVGTFVEDETAGLSGDLADVHGAIREGHTTIEAIAEALAIRKDKVSKAVTALVKRRLLAPRATSRSPLRVVEKGQF